MRKIMETFGIDVFYALRMNPRYQITEAEWALGIKDNVHTWNKKTKTKKKKDCRLILTTEGHWMNHH